MTTMVLEGNPSRTLAELETIIERGEQTFMEVGIALREIRDGGLYKADHATFEEYCQKRWGWKKSHAYRLIEAGKVAEILSPVGDNLPRNERQARELVGLEPEQLRQVGETVDFSFRPIKRRHYAASSQSNRQSRN